MRFTANSRNFDFTAGNVKIVNSLESNNASSNTLTAKQGSLGSGAGTLSFGGSKPTVDGSPILTENDLPSPTISIELTGDVTGTGNTTLQKLSNGHILIETTGWSSNGGPSMYVSTFNTRHGNVTLLDSDVIAALGYTPLSNSGSVPASSLTGIIPPERLSGTYDISITGGIENANNAVNANNASYLNNQPGSYYLDANNLTGVIPYAAMSGNYNIAVQNSFQLNNQFASYYTNASNMSTGILPPARLSGTYNINITGSVEASNTSLTANNSLFLNNQPGSYYLDANNLTGIIPPERLSGTYDISITGGIENAVNANNASFLNGQPGTYYSNANNISTGVLQAARLEGFYNITVASATYFGGQNASYYTNASNMSTGILPPARLSGTYNITANTALNANNASFLNGQPGTYYSNAANLTGSVAAARLSGTYNITANNSLFLNNQPGSYYLDANNLTGILPPARLSGTYNITANNATNLNGQAASYYLDAANLTGTVAPARLSGTYDINITGSISNANNATNLNGQAASYYTNASNMSTGILPPARLSGTYNINITGGIENAVNAINANNSAYLNGQPGSYYLDANNLTGTLPPARLSGTYDINITGSISTALNANNASFLNGQPGTYYSNAANLTGTVAAARLANALSYISPLVPAANRIIVYTSNTAASLITLTSYGQTLLAAESASDFRNLLELSNNSTLTIQNIIASNNITANTLQGNINWSYITNRPNSLTGYGITDAQPLNTNLTSISIITANGYIKKQGTSWVAEPNIPISDIIDLSSSLNNKYDKVGGVLVGRVIFHNSFTSNLAPINVPNVGTTDPTSLSNGDIWHRSNTLFARLNNQSVQIIHSNTYPIISQIDAEAGSSNTIGWWSPVRVAQAIAALAPGGGGGDISGKANSNILISAGNGMTGGGDLTANRTLSLGTPGTLSGSTTNLSSGNTHTHALSANLTSWDGITPAAKANTVHTHVISDVTGLQANLDIKLSNPGSFIETTTNVTRFRAGEAGVRGYITIEQGSATQPGYLTWRAADGTRLGFVGWSRGGDNIAFDTENGWNVHFNKRPIFNNQTPIDTGNFTSIPAANATTSGLFTAAGFNKLAGIETGATLNSSDTILLARANHTGTQAISTITGLQTALDGKQANGSYVLQSTSLTAGNGMTGGGDWSTSRTITLGTPSTITGSTTNQVLTNSHTHALSIGVTDVTGLATELGLRLRVDTNGQGLNATQQSNARTNLALGNSAILNIGTTANTVAAGNDARILDIANKAPNSLTRTDTGASAVTLLDKLNSTTPTPIDFATIEYNEASPTNAAAKLQQMIDATPEGGTFDGNINGTYYVNSPLHVRTGKGLCGGVVSGQMMRRVGYNTRKGTIVLGPSGQIVLYEGAHLKNLTIVSTQAATPPTREAGPGTPPFDVAAATARVLSWTGTAVRGFSTDNADRHFGNDLQIENCTIVGFDTGIDVNYNARFRIANVRIDCHNGVKAQKTYDVARIIDLHCWPFWCANYAMDGTTACVRNGAGINLGLGLAGRNDGILVDRYLSYGFKYGIWLQGGPGGNDSNYACAFNSCWIDAASSMWATQQPIGIYVTGNAQATTFNGCHVDSNYTNWYLNHNAGSAVTLYNCSSGGGSQNAIRLGPGDGIINGFMAAGSVSAECIRCDSVNGYWKISNYLNHQGGTAFITQSNAVQRRKIYIDTKTVYTPSATFNPELWDSNVEAILASNLSVANNDVLTTVAYNSEVLDAWDEYTHTTGTFVPATTGVYDINVQFGFNATNALSGTQHVNIYRNGAFLRRILMEEISSTQTFVRTATSRERLTAGQSITIRVSSTRGGTMSSTHNMLRINRVY